MIKPNYQEPEVRISHKGLALFSAGSLSRKAFITSVSEITQNGCCVVEYIEY